MSEHNLFSDKQFGFYEGKSIFANVLLFRSSETEILDRGAELNGLHGDIMETFAIVPHVRLLQKTIAGGRHIPNNDNKTTLHCNKR